MSINSWILSLATWSKVSRAFSGELTLKLVSRRWSVASFPSRCSMNTLSAAVKSVPNRSFKSLMICDSASTASAARGRCLPPFCGSSGRVPVAKPNLPEAVGLIR